MKRILVAVVILALLSVTLVSLASAATGYILGPGHAAQFAPASAQAGASTITLVKFSPARDRGHADEASHIDAPRRANGGCPFRSNPPTSGSSPIY